MPRPVNVGTTVVVTVTYSNRKHLLKAVLERLEDLELARVVIVNNGATWLVKQELEPTYSSFIDVVDMGRNTGSAQGFAAGIQRALDLGAEYIWLLDDDNRPHADTLSRLIETHLRSLLTVPRDQLATVALRPEQYRNIVNGFPEHRLRLRPNSFRGFHLADIPYKLWRRLPWSKSTGPKIMPPTVDLQQAPYGGLFFHRDLIAAIGLPNAQLVLYVDDTEFTCRITNRNRGRIIMVTDAKIDDLESSWCIRERFGNSLVAQLCGEGDFRAYYGMRNGAYFDETHIKEDKLVFWLNRTAYIYLLFFLSLYYKRFARFRLLRDALKNGLAHSLGEDPRFSLHD